MNSRVEELKLMPYEEYLNTPEWREKRAQALDRSNFRCQVCNSPDDLQVHHRTYENKGDEKPEDLTVLCEKCHSLYHFRLAVDYSAKPIRDALEKFYDNLEYIYMHPGEVSGIPTGFDDLDGLLGGFQRSDLIVVAGRPGSGKTSLALSIALSSARRFQKRVAIYILEMSSEQVIQRLIAAETGIECLRFKSGNIKEDEWHAIIGATNLLSNANIFIDQTPAISVQELCADAHRLHKEHGLDLLIVDYVQLMRGDPGSENRYQEIRSISRTLKTLARVLNIPILALSQVSRQVEARHDKHPTLSDLRESGSLEEDADVILFLYRDELYDPCTDFPNIAEINVAKNRNGPIGVFSVYFEKNLMQFVDLEVRTKPLE